MEKVEDGFTPVPDAAYHLRLRDVDPTREGPKGPYWSWDFEIVEPGRYEGRRLWNNTSLAKEALFSFQQTFKAFGVPVDTDTDDLLGQVVKGIVSTRTIQSGPRKGDPANQIDRLVPKDPDFEVPESMQSETAGVGGGQPNAEDLF